MGVNFLDSIVSDADEDGKGGDSGVGDSCIDIVDCNGINKEGGNEEGEDDVVVSDVRDIADADKDEEDAGSESADILR